MKLYKLAPHLLPLVWLGLAILFAITAAKEHVAGNHTAMQANFAWSALLGLATKIYYINQRLNDHASEIRKLWSSR